MKHFKEYITLINHASVFIENQNKQNILTDPWYEGSIFNDGWSLLYENNHNQIKKILNKVNYIYLSHEHPDHFSINFFKKYSNILIKKDIKIIFQKTIDKRLESFLKKRFKLNFLILDDSFNSNSLIKKNNMNKKLTLFKNSYIDSMLIFESKKFYHINFNDCNFSDSEIEHIKKFTTNKNKKKILYIQFSYAAYRSNKKWLKEAALFKLKHIVQVSKALEIEIVIPFASFINFSHKDNQYLNKYKNLTNTTSAFLSKNKIKHCFLNPKQSKINLDNLISDEILRNQINKKSILFWDQRFLKKNNFIKKDKKEFLNQNAIDEFLQRIKVKNSLFLLFFFRYVSFGFLFGDVIIFVSDINKIYKVNFFSIKEINDKKKISINMKSDVFLFMIKQVYGVDTIIVNGRFKEIKKNAFLNLILSIGFTILNQTEKGVNFKTLLSKFSSKKISFLFNKLIFRNS